MELNITSAPYHPATNGLAERAVQTMKRGLKKLRDGSMASRLAKILLAYRTAPQSTTGESPAQLLQNRQIRTRLNFIKPSRSCQVDHRQQQQKVCHDESVKRRQFSKGERVYVQNFGTGTRWLPAIVEEITGPVSCLVILEDNWLIRRHFDHIIHRRHESTSWWAAILMYRKWKKSSRKFLIAPSSPLDLIRTWIPAFQIVQVGRSCHKISEVFQKLNPCKNLWQKLFHRMCHTQELSRPIQKGNVNLQTDTNQISDH